ncbi:hypothetical protein CYMTET_27089 [Cymbomonas tetramitiformis]|uniref:Uncharacterized protein n=1 Tax=Cymbomonas tetramitiformis TaxID=36881 RepID=A0AAE0FRZ5_9CHLO|nr:hypothetical protein CYMTET_27089 [Cymbomonas tetramitiformis]
MLDIDKFQVLNCLQGGQAEDNRTWKNSVEKTTVNMELNSDSEQPLGVENLGDNRSPTLMTEIGEIPRRVYVRKEAVRKPFADFVDLLSEPEWFTNTTNPSEPGFVWRPFWFNLFPWKMLVAAVLSVVASIVILVGVANVRDSANDILSMEKFISVEDVGKEYINMRTNYEVILIFLPMFAVVPALMTGLYVHALMRKGVTTQLINESSKRRKKWYNIQNTSQARYLNIGSTSCAAFVMLIFFVLIYVFSILSGVVIGIEQAAVHSDSIFEVQASLDDIEEQIQELSSQLTSLNSSIASTNQVLDASTESCAEYQSLLEYVQTSSGSESDSTSSDSNSTSADGNSTSSDSNSTSADGNSTSSDSNSTSARRPTATPPRKLHLVTSAPGNSTSSDSNSTSAGGNSTSSDGNSTSANGKLHLETPPRSDSNSTSANGNSTSSESNSTSADGNSTSSDGNSSSADGNSTSSDSDSPAGETPPRLAETHFGRRETPLRADGNSTSADGNSTSADGNSSSADGNSTSSALAETMDILCSSDAASYDVSGVSENIESILNSDFLNSARQRQCLDMSYYKWIWDEFEQLCICDEELNELIGYLQDMFGALLHIDVALFLQVVALIVVVACNSANYRFLLWRILLENGRLDKVPEGLVLVDAYGLPSKPKQLLLLQSPIKLESEEALFKEELPAACSKETSIKEEPSFVIEESVQPMNENPMFPFEEVPLSARESSLSVTDRL